jgi:hypothetical protein
MTTHPNPNELINRMGKLARRAGASRALIIRWPDASILNLDLIAPSSGREEKIELDPKSAMLFLASFEKSDGGDLGLQDLLQQPEEDLELHGKIAERVINRFFSEAGGLPFTLAAAKLGIIVIDELDHAEAKIGSVEGAEKKEKPPAKRLVEVHNRWTIYWLNPDGTPAEHPLACATVRPQDWGNPGWKYFYFKWEWVNGPDNTHYINHFHAWTDRPLETWEYPKFFAPLLSQIMTPGDPPELCGRDYLHPDDFWSEEWGPQPPFFDDPEEEVYEYLFTSEDFTEDEEKG